MATKITDIPYWGIFLECFPESVQIFDSKNPENLSKGHWLTIARWWRNALLYESDWSQISDNSLSENSRQIWRDYRKELRDITDTYPNPKDIVFPDPPS